MCKLKKINIRYDSKTNYLTSMVAVDIDEILKGLNISNTTAETLNKTYKKLGLTNKSEIANINISLRLHKIEQGNLGIVKFKYPIWERKECNEACNMIIEYLRQYVKINIRGLEDNTHG